MSRFTCCCLLLALAPVARSEMDLRLAPWLRAGAAGYSDLFLGANAGPGVEVVMAPSVAGDASLTPWFKVRAQYDFALTYAQVNASSAYNNLGSLTLRTRPLSNLWIEIAGRVVAERFDVAGSTQEGVAGALVTTYDSLAVAPRLRYLGDGFDAWVEYALVSAQSVAFIEDDPAFTGPALETVQRGAASASWAASPAFALAAQYRVTFNDANVGALRYWSNEGVAVGVVGVGPGWLRLEAGLQHTNFSVLRPDPTTVPPGQSFYRRFDDLVRASVTATIPLRAGMTLEVSYGYARNFSTERDPQILPAVVASRHVAYAGLKVEIEPWRN